MSPQDHIILLSAKIHPSVKELQALDAQVALVDDWEAVAECLIERGFGPLFYKKTAQLANRKLIPAESIEKLKQSYYVTLSRGMVLYDVFRKVAEAFSSNGIEVVALKGIHLAEWLYGDIGLRQFSDIDLLVRKKDGEKCLQILTSLEFVQSGEEISHLIAEKAGIIHYPAMLLNDVSVELHIDLHNRRNTFQLDVNKIIGNSVPLLVNHTPVLVMELHDLLIYLCIHLDKHFVGGEVQFTSFTDITNLLDIHAADIDWLKLESSCSEYNCIENVYKYLLLAAEYCHAPVPEEVIEKYSGSLSAEDKELFIRYLNGFREKAYTVSTHLNNITEMKSAAARLRYLLKVVFPSREFMELRYPIKHSSLFWLYYPTRHWTGLKGLWKMKKKPEF